MRKVGVIGSGTVGAMALITAIKNNCQTTLIHNPKIPRIEVGEAVTHEVIDLLNDLFDHKTVNKILENSDSIPRKGTRFFWEKVHGNNFDFNYPLSGLHLNSAKFSDAIITELQQFENFNIVEDNVIEINNKTIFCDNENYSFDLIIDCSGFPNKEQLEKDYIIPEFKSVNSVIIYPHKKDYNETYSSMHYHKHGWMFGIPVKGRKAFGFLYDNELTTEEEALKTFKETVPFIEEDKVRKLSWNWFYKKKIYENGVFTLGNKLMFLEPQAGLALHFYLAELKYFFEIIDYINEEEYNAGYIREVESLLDLVAINYVGQDNNNYEFWKETKIKATKQLKESEQFQRWILQNRLSGGFTEFNSHSSDLMKQIIDGYKIDLNDLIGKKQIGIIGAGTVGALTLLSVISEFKKAGKLNEIMVTLFHDPNKPKVSVGESSTYKVLHLLKDVFGEDLSSKILEDCNSTLRTKTKFFWKEATGEDFQINYDDHGVHFNSSLFSDLIIKYASNLPFVNIVEKNVNKKLDLDLIFDCSGTPDDWDNYIKPEFNSVNTVLLYPHMKEYNENFTSSVWTKNGWMFGVPLKHRKAYGYLYNNTITDHKNALQDFKEIAPFIEEDKVRKLDWQFYYRKNIIEENTVYLGNKLFFFEPAGALPLHFYSIMVGHVVEDFIKNSYKISQYFIRNQNETYKTDIVDMLDLIAFNYVGQVKEETNFWKKTKEKALSHLKKSEHFQNWLSEIPDGYIDGYWTHPGQTMKEYGEGYKINLEELKNV